MDAHWESGRLVWNAKVHCLCWEKAESKTPSFVKELKKGPASCQTGEKTHTAVAEQGSPVIHTQLVSGLCLCWEGEMSFLGARFWQSKGKVRI